MIRGSFPLILMLHATTSAVVDFRHDVWPILENRCIECHQSPYEKNGVRKEPKAGLRLDGAAYIMHGSDDGAVVKVDHPSRSSLYQRVILQEEDADHMPPKGGSLTIQEKEIIRMWIAQGVDFGDWTGATDGIEKLVQRKEDDQLPQASYLEKIDQLAVGVMPVEDFVLEQISEKSKLLVRPLGVGSVLLEARAVTEPETVDDFALEALLPIKQNLVKLDLRKTSISDKSIQFLSSFPRLTNLNLMETSTESNSILYFRGNQSLESLNLVNTQVSEEITNALLTLPQLQKVYLWKTKFSSMGISLLQEKAKHLQVSF